MLGRVNRADSPSPSRNERRHAVAVVGGATAGAEIAGRLAEAGVNVVVFERNPRPYGKIEDGLPRWHKGLREKEYAAIDAKLGNENVRFVPCTALGRDLSVEELIHGWGFSALVLASGAWRDRRFPVPGADAWIGRGLVYQNPFIIAFNHAEEASNRACRFPMRDNVLVVGGGLASIDVVKVLMLETTRQALLERGIEIPLIELETKGIPRSLEAHGLAWDELGLQGCTLFFRRGPEETSLVSIPPGADADRVEKVKKSRIKVLEKAMEKYCFRFEPFAVPDGLLIEEGHVAGLRLRRTRVEGETLILTQETFESRGPYVVSSIGSIPEPIEGLPMAGELFAFSVPRHGRFAQHPRIFSVGNAVTGQGNIVASRNHARLVSEEALERYLGLREGAPPSHIPGGEIHLAAETAAEVMAHLDRATLPSSASCEALLERVTERQRAVGYLAGYRRWIEQATPKI
jgi:NADPH-dependent glutamate synthase beta subunit-like oxidoreductase